jgi:hypothetical protein
MKPQVAVQLTTDATVLEENYHRTPTALGHQLVDLLRAAIAPTALEAVALWWLTATPVAEAAAVGAPHMGLGRVGGGGDRGGRGHADGHVTGVSRGGYDARRRIEKIRRKKSSTQARTTASPPFLLDFAICSSQRNSSL